MASVPLANNAWGLACIVCAFTLLVAPVTLTPYKYAAFLFIITLHTLILCQCAPLYADLAAQTVAPQFSVAALACM